MSKRLSREQLVQIVNHILRPSESGLTSEEMNLELLHFCINCPDPVAAMEIVVETPPPTTAQLLVDKALACKARDVAQVPEEELPSTHPLRTMSIDE